MLVRRFTLDLIKKGYLFSIFGTLSKAVRGKFSLLSCLFLNVNFEEWKQGELLRKNSPEESSGCARLLRNAWTSKSETCRAATKAFPWLVFIWQFNAVQQKQRSKIGNGLWTICGSSFTVKVFTGIFYTWIICWRFDKNRKVSPVFTAILWRSDGRFWTTRERVSCDSLYTQCVAISHSTMRSQTASDGICVSWWELIRSPNSERYQKMSCSFERTHSDRVVSYYWRDITRE